MPMDITAFLLARITEDEAVAHEVLAQTEGFQAEVATGSEADVARCGDNLEVSYTISSARVLAECEAKRRIVERHAPYDNIQVRRQTRTLARDTLLALALPYADHADYDERWRV